MSDAYFEQAIAVLRGVMESQRAGIERAAEMLVETVAGGQAVFSFGASHSFIVTEELVYRTGGLMLINPIYPHGMNLSVRPMTLTSRLERVPGLGAALLHEAPARSGDLLLLTSTSGRNAVIIDMALAARERGIRVIGLTAVAYSRSVDSRHPSGRKLMDLCDLVLDNGAPAGDAAVAVAGFPQKIGALSTVTGCAVANAVVVAAVEKMVARGLTPPVFVSANLDGGDEHNARLLSENRDRIHYM